MPHTAAKTAEATQASAWFIFAAIMQNRLTKFKKSINSRQKTIEIPERTFSFRNE